MTTTLLAASRPDQRYPAVREAAALLAGGLRARTGAPVHRGGAAIWVGGLHLAVPLLLAWGAAEMVGESLFVRNGFGAGPPQMSSATNLTTVVSALLITAALIGYAADRRLVALALGAAGAAVPFWGTYVGDLHAALQVGTAMILALALPHRPVPAARRPWRWLAAVPAFLLVLPAPLFSWTIAPGLAEWPYTLGHIAVPLAVALPYAFVDARVPIAAGVMLASLGIPAVVALSVSTAATSYPRLPTAMVIYLLAWTALFTVPMAAGALAARRQARL